MANITLTDAKPVVTKAIGGGGRELLTLTDTKPVVTKAIGGGGREWLVLTVTRPYTPYNPSTVQTNPATNLEVDRITLNGTLLNDNGETCKCGFEWGLTTSYGHVNLVTGTKATGETFSTLVTGIELNKLYHFRAFAYNVYGIVQGADQTFNTLFLAPIVITQPVIGLGASQAILDGHLSSDGGETCSCWFEWGIDITLASSTPSQSKTQGQTIQALLSGLYPNTRYYYRVCASNSQGIKYGDMLSFVTKEVIGRSSSFARSEL